MAISKRLTSILATSALITISLTACSSSGASSGSGTTNEPPDDGRSTSTVTAVSPNAFQYSIVFELDDETAARCDISSDVICGLLKVGDTITYTVWSSNSDSPILQEVRRESRVAPR